MNFHTADFLVGEKEILAIHGVGPATMPVIKTALAEENLQFKN